jgi:dCMP deaminase
MNWDNKFIQLALNIASWSKDRSRKVGCVVVGPDHEIRTTGYNGFPRCIDDNCEHRHERPAKYLWTEHAERNAIYNAARCGIGLDGCTIYVPWYPCMDCARSIVQSGITTIVCNEPDFADPKWGSDFKVVKELFDELSTKDLFNVRYVSST